MKTRNSLVSNSSSSSFILIGVPFEIDRLNENHIGKTTYVLGNWSGEGDDVFMLSDKNMLKFIQDYPSKFKVYINSQISTDEPIKLKEGYFGGEIVLGGKKDDYSSGCVKNLIERYMSADDLKKQATESMLNKYGVKDENKKLAR